MRSGLWRLGVSMHSLLMQVDTVRPPADSLKTVLRLTAHNVYGITSYKGLSHLIVSVWFYYMDFEEMRGTPP